MTTGPLQSAGRGDPSAPWLVADIGGTHARFALAEPGRQRPVLRDIRVLRTADFASLQQAALHYMTDVDASPRRAALAIAAPIQGDEIRMINGAWSFRRGELAGALGLDDVQILNDFGAAALGVSALQADEYELLYGTAHAGLADPVSVLGPGTGLGVALLLRDRQRHWQVVETEGGHISFAPLCAEERRLHDWLEQRHGRVSVERLLSGPGLAEIDDLLGQSGQPDRARRSTAEIVAAAMAGKDDLARAALGRFCAMLGSFAGDVALLHGARTLAIAGGIIPRIIPFLKGSQFHQRLLAKGRFAGYLQAVNILVLTHPAPGLLGAAVHLAGVHSGTRESPSEESRS